MPVLSSDAVPSHVLGQEVFVVNTCACENTFKKMTLKCVSNNRFRFFIVY